MSTNFEVLMVDPGRLVDLGEMSDAFADSQHALAKGGVHLSGEAPGGVLCTTEIGLLCSTRKGPAASPRDGMPVIQRVVLLKPKVVLESVTRALEAA
jgi:hypothetical protein